MDWFIGISAFAAGGALIWVSKEKIQSIWTDASTLASKLRDKANAIESAAKK